MAERFPPVVETALLSSSLEQATPRTRPRLTWNDGTAHALVLERTMTLGSAPQADVVVADRAVSRLHAELAPEADGLWVRDLDSRNGTYVNDVKLERARVPDGATVRVGQTQIRVDYEAPAPPKDLWTEAFFGPLLGRSAAMRELFTMLAHVSKTDGSVLVTGETGTGKELVARAIHDASPRRGGPFIVIDCGSLPDNLIESELFGHARGAFTGALNAHTGAFEAADGGTIFLDEIGELPLALQPKLLRVLESRTVRRLGEVQHRRVDVRVVAATHRDLRSRVNEGVFREDLYFRLCVLPVRLPPLRNRRADIPFLLDRFLDALGAAPIPAAAKHTLMQRPWLGNVRELRNFAERVHALGVQAAMAMDDISAPLPAMDAAPIAAASDEPAPPSVHALAFESGVDPGWFDHGFKEFRDRWLEAGEREYVRRVLERTGGKYPAAAVEARLERTYFYRIAKRYGF
jgi:two-component system, NtrC family, response regulator GlrR